MSGVVEHRFLALGVGDEVGRQVALVELHTLGELELDAEGVRLFHRDGAVLAHLVDGFGQHVADGRVGGGDRSHLGDLGLAVNFLGLLGQVVDGRLDGLLDPPLQPGRAGAGGHVAQPFGDQGLGQDRRRRGAVAGHVVGLGGDFLHQLGAHVLERVVQLDFPGDGHAVVGDGRGAELLLDHHVATFRSQGDLDGVGQLVDAGLQPTAGGLVEFQNLGHDCDELLSSPFTSANGVTHRRPAARTAGSARSSG